MALRVSGVRVTGDSVEEWENGSHIAVGGGGGAGGGFAAWIALARAMVRLPWPVPASRISRGGGRGDLSSG